MFKFPPMKNILNLFVFMFILSCSTPQISEDGFYGESFKQNKFLELNDLTQQMASQDTVQAVVKGRVESVCQKKGCWMNIVSEDGKSIFVKFKDYGFFMPLDIVGQEVVMNGIAYKEVTSVEELKHYAEDEGLPREEIENIIVPKEEFKFMASGVYVANSK